MYQISMALHTEWPNSEHLITKCLLEMYDFCRCGHEGFDWGGRAWNMGFPLINKIL